MNTYSKQIVIVALLLLGIGACKEKDCHKDGTCAEDYRRLRLSDEAKSYLWADTGSWWIYKNSKTGELDTQTVTYFNFDSAISKGSRNYSKHITLEYDVLTREIFSTYTKWLYKDGTTGYDANATPFKGLTFGIRRFVSGEGINTCFYTPFDYPANSYCQYKGIDSTLTLHGKTYTNVVRFELARDDIWEQRLNCIRSNNVYYWAKDVGLIKKEMKTCNYSWELIDYKIIR